MALHFAVESAFDNLLTCWKHHCGVQDDPTVGLSKRSASRARLDRARGDLQRLRRAMYPTEVETEAIWLTVLCPMLDQIVHLGAQNRCADSATRLLCPCGERIDMAHDRVT